MNHLRSIIGVFVLLGLAWLLSNNKRKIDFRVIGWGLGLQFLFALLILKTGAGKAFFAFFQGAFNRLLAFSREGARFIFGDLLLGLPADSRGPYQVIDAGSGGFKDLTELMSEIGPAFAFKVLPAIIFFASLIAVLYHLKIMQLLVKGFAYVMKRTMGTSGSESLAAAGNIFIGMSEAPLLIRPYITTMSMSELMALMTCGFATVAGTAMAAYVSFGMEAGHLMAASVMSAPAALVVAKIMLPETERKRTEAKIDLKAPRETVNVIDAAARGALTGLTLALNIAAMLVAFIAFIALLNYLLGLAGTSLSRILGLVFSPVAFFLGVPLEDVMEVGRLLGTKISINEFVAYIDLAGLKGQLSDRAFTIATYALCGFANFGSIAMQIGCIGSLAPERKSDIARLGLKAMAGGAIASCITAAVAGIFLG